MYLVLKLPAEHLPRCCRGKTEQDATIHVQRAEAEIVNGGEKLRSDPIDPARSARRNGRAGQNSLRKIAPSVTSSGVFANITRAYSVAQTDDESTVSRFTVNLAHTLTHSSRPIERQNGSVSRHQPYLIPSVAGRP